MNRDPANQNIVCQPTSPAKRARSLELIQQLKAKLQSMTELADGYAFSFSAGAQTQACLEELLIEERCCCPFLEFSLSKTNSETLALTVVGPPSAKPIIAEAWGASTLAADSGLPGKLSKGGFAMLLSSAGLGAICCLLPLLGLGLMSASVGAYLDTTLSALIGLGAVLIGAGYFWKRKSGQHTSPSCGC